MDGNTTPGTWIENVQDVFAFIKNEAIYHMAKWENTDINSEDNMEQFYALCRDLKIEVINTLVYYSNEDDSIDKVKKKLSASIPAICSMIAQDCVLFRTFKERDEFVAKLDNSKRYLV